jgi:myo-inositol-1(or 4)-monophosphatase
VKKSSLAEDSLQSMEERAVQCVLGAGKILLRYFGRVTNPREKEHQSSVVCDADLASEEYLLKRIAAWFPGHNVISEEAGRSWRAGEYTWVIDPLDGTSNFVAGLPWFGVQLGVLHGSKPVLAVMYLPVEGLLYLARSGQGARRNGKRIQVTPELDLKKVLCAFGFDPAPAKRDRKRIGLLFAVSRAVRNTRATNSLVDFCCTADGRLGGCINLKTKIWDIVPISVILPEAGGLFTDLKGQEIVFQLDSSAPEREYAVLGASRHLHSKLAALTRGRA